MIISGLVALTRKGVIGVENRLPWHLPEDLKRFKKLTLGHTVLMGRKTYDSIGRPLPGRRNIIISRDKTLKINGCEVLCSIDEAIKNSKPDEHIFIIGGGEIFTQSMNKIDDLYLTWIEKEFDGDVCFPINALELFVPTSEENFELPFKHSYQYCVKRP